MFGYFIQFFIISIVCVNAAFFDAYVACGVCNCVYDVCNECFVQMVVLGKRCLMWFNGRYMLTLFVNMKVLVENDLVCSMESSSACNYALGLFEYPRHVEAQCTQCGPLSRMVS